MKAIWALLLLFNTAPHAQDIKPFTSDGCSSFPNGTSQQQNLWLSCCTEHDKAYWKGGSFQQRLDADLAFKKCVSAIGEPVIAELMLSGVRVGGSPYWPTEFRWGYGWPYPRGYKALDSEQSLFINKNNTLMLMISCLVTLIAVLHLYFLVLEMFFWEKSLGRKTFKLTADFAAASKALAANQGLYNGFLAAGLIWGLLMGNEGIAILLFFLSCILIAGIYGSLTVSKTYSFCSSTPSSYYVNVIALYLVVLSILCCNKSHTVFHMF